MGSIHVLDTNTINRIAAGEVIERPASVVKELCENALDAQAASVTVQIQDGGMDTICVTDDGTGIPEAEVPFAFLPHATSKIKNAEDLDGICTLGFRGEALPSIANVASVELTTKTKEALYAAYYKIEDGVEKERQTAGAPAGTTVVVKNLFLHIPARRKFLKTAQTEAAHIEALLYRLALSKPQVAFTFISNGKLRLQTAGKQAPLETAAALFGRGVAENLLPLSKTHEEKEISGLIGLPQEARGNRRYEFFFLNGRLVTDATLSRAVEEAYRPYLMQHKFPFVILYITLDPKEVDVNVHPGKREVRFQKRGEIYRFLQEAVGCALRDGMRIPEVSVKGELPGREGETSPGAEGDQKDFFALMRERVSSRYEKERELAEHHELPNPAAQENRQLTWEAEDALAHFSEETAYTAARRRHFRLLGQLFDTYWLIEDEDCLLFVDQHAAHEKVLFERLMHAFKAATVSSQHLLPPLVVSLSLMEQALLRRHEAVFRKFGFVIESFEGNEAVIRAVPAMLESLQEKALFLEMLDSLSADAGKAFPAESIENRFATMACKAAVKGHDVLSAVEMETLLDELLTLENPYQCPHGRPTMFRISRREIEKKFQRIVS